MSGTVHWIPVEGEERTTESDKAPSPSSQLTPAELKRRKAVHEDWTKRAVAGLNRHTRKLPDIPPVISSRADRLH